MSTSNMILKHMAEKSAGKGKTVGQILDTLNEEQRNVVNYLIAKALQVSEGKNDEDEKK